MSKSKPHAGGRPTLYDDSIMNETIEYIDSLVLYEDYMQETVVAGVGIVPITKQRAGRLPSLSGLALKLCVNRDTIYEWAKHHSEFSDTIDQIKVMQREYLMIHGLQGGYNASFAKFVANNLTDLKEKQEITHEISSIQIDDADKQL